LTSNGGWRRWYPVAGVLVGIIYGLALRLIATSRIAGPIMMLGYLVGGPYALGFLSVFVVENNRSCRSRDWLFLPWAPLTGALLGAILALLEGWICVVLFAPIGYALASAGGVTGGGAARALRTRRSKGVTMVCVAVLPFCIVPWEGPVFFRLEIRRVESTIDIHASPGVVWRNLARVPPIHTEELPASWGRRIGLPGPIETTLSQEGVGGVRRASFEGGVVFVDTVDVWEPAQRLGFSMRPVRVPRETLDEHVTVGGDYFDVIRGDYRLEPLANGVTRVHLSSQYRLSTDFNWYAHLWTDAAIANSHWTILSVIRRRCE